MSTCSIIKKFDNQLTYCNSWNNLDGHSRPVEMALFDRPYVATCSIHVSILHLSEILPLVMEDLWNRAGHYILALCFHLSFFFLSFFLA